jgi:hypothetical protein
MTNLLYILIILYGKFLNNDTYTRMFHSYVLVQNCEIWGGCGVGKLELTQVNVSTHMACLKFLPQVNQNLKLLKGRISVPDKTTGSCLNPRLPRISLQGGSDGRPGPRNLGEKSQRWRRHDEEQRGTYLGHDAGGSAANRVRRLPVHSYNIVITWQWFVSPIFLCDYFISFRRINYTVLHHLHWSSVNTQFHVSCAMSSAFRLSGSSVLFYPLYKEGSMCQVRQVRPGQDRCKTY